MTEIIWDGTKIQFYSEEDGTDLRIKINDAFYIYHNRIEIHPKHKEDNTMKVSYKGVTGELVRLERSEIKDELHSCCIKPAVYLYNLEIWDGEKRCKASFPGVSLKDVKFLGGEVTYG